MLGTRKLALKTSVAATWSWRECVVSRALLWSLMVRILPPIWCNLKQKDKDRQETAAQGRRAFSHRTRKNHHGLITKLTGIFHLLFPSMNLALFITGRNTSNSPTLLFRRITWLGSVILQEEQHLLRQQPSTLYLCDTENNFDGLGLCCQGQWQPVAIRFPHE